MAEKGIDLSTLSGIRGLDIGCSPGDIAERAPLIALFPGVEGSVAAGPWCCASPGYDKDRCLSRLREDIGKHKPRIIGEIGLDYYWKYGGPGDQEDLFVSQLEMAHDLGLPVSVHSRDADSEMLETLRKHQPGRRGIMHCYSSGPELALELVEMGWKLSFAGNVTYKGNGKIREALAAIPLSAVLAETDSPYLAPVPLRGRLNTPLNIVHTYEAMAEIKGISVGELEKIVEENFEAVLS